MNTETMLKIEKALSKLKREVAHLEKQLAIKKDEIKRLQQMKEMEQ